MIEESPVETLASLIDEKNKVVFSAWNGDEPPSGQRCELHLQADSKIYLYTLGYGINFIHGTFSILNGSLIEIKMDVSDPFTDWPIMLLERDGEDLLLYRSDGKTSWHDDYPFYPESIDGFWPLRASKMEKPDH